MDVPEQLEHVSCDVVTGEAGEEELVEESGAKVLSCELFAHRNKQSDLLIKTKAIRNFSDLFMERNRRKKY